MSRENGNARWIKRGRQRAAVFQVLRKPMTTSEICRAAQAFNPHIQLRDVWFIMGQFKARGLAVCLNPKHATGKVYALTERGRGLAEHAFGTRAFEPTPQIDWRRYAKVARAKSRRLVLMELAALNTGGGITATMVRKSLRERHPLGLNPTIRALKELERAGLASSHTLDAKDRRRRYTITKPGAAIARQLSA